MPDTPENQAEYPQAKTQKPGCGLPIARVLVVFSLAVGAVLEAAIGQYKGKQTGESSLFRALHDVLESGDVALADRGFSGWFDLALLWQRGVDVVVRKHQKRATDFRQGQRLGHDDHLVRIPKPPRPKWMPPEQYAALPNDLELREVRVRVKQRGFRTKMLVVVTTLLDAEEFPAEEIAVSAVEPSSLASRTPVEKPEDRSANGSLAVQESAPRPQRVLHAPAGVQPAPPRHGAGGHRSEGSSLANQLQGNFANAQQFSAAAGFVHAFGGRLCRAAQQRCGAPRRQSSRPL